VTVRGFDDVHAVLRANRAGAGESCLSPEEIIEVFCHRKHLARDGRCLLKGKHEHSGPEATDRCVWGEELPRTLVRGELADLKTRNKE
jgi:hypothetical protein